MSQQYTISEVKKHKNSKSAWMIIHNNVYDVTSYIYEHPGGADNILDYAGKDGTDAFEETGHSSDARIVLEKFKIGTLIASEHTKYIETCCKAKSTKKTSCPSVPKPEYEDKSWRTYDGSSKREYYKPPKSPYKPPEPEKPERRVPSILVPRESSKLKWAMLALAGALILGIVIRKYAS